MNSEKIYFARFAAVWILCLGLTTPAAATDAFMYGEHGGRPFRVQCPANSYVVGFEGNVGAWIDRMAVICAPWSATEGKLGEPSALSDRAVGDSTGGTPQSKSCPEGWIVGPEYDATFAREPKVLHSIDFQCTPTLSGDANTIHRTFGSSSSIDKGLFLGKELKLGPAHCPEGELAIGFYGRSGLFIDGFGLMCAPRPQPTSVGVEARREKGPIVASGPAAEALKKGPIVAPAPAEPLKKGPIVSNAPEAPPADKPPPTQNPPPPEIPKQPESPAANICGPPGGTAVVTIADPRLTKVNVRDGPGGTVLGTVPEGAKVSIVGSCGPPGSAGLAAPEPTTSESGWCQIDKPIAGCVSAQFLALGGKGASVSLSFVGDWDTVAGGIPHSIILRQNRGSVTGEYTADDGSSGTISGRVDGNVLRFSWSQADGVAGTGKFVLSDDGQSFSGSYTFDERPDQVAGSWNGTRQ